MTWANRGTDDEREAVVRAALGQNDALQRLDYGGFPGQHVRAAGRCRG